MHLMLLKWLGPLPYKKLPSHLLMEIERVTNLDKLMHASKSTVVRRSARCGMWYGPEKGK